MNFKEYFPNGVQPGQIIPYAHKGEWAVHEILPFLFSEIGAFHLAVATFNISEDSLRPIFFMKDRGELLSARFLFDNNVKRHKIDMLFFAAGIADQVRTSSTHMKVTLCWNDDIGISIVGSANMNRNIRHEAGFIATQAGQASSDSLNYPADNGNKIFTYYKNYFNNVFNNDSMPFVWE